jgi:hypothetical protein
LLIFVSQYSLMDCVISRWMPCTMIFVPVVAARAQNPPRRRDADAFWRIAAGFETSPDRAPKKAGDASAGARDPRGIAAHRGDAAQRAEGADARCRRARAATAGDAETAKSDITLVFPGKILYV